VFLLFPGVRHRYRPDFRTGWDEHWVVFDGDIPRRLVKSGVFSPSEPVFSGVSSERLAKLFHRIADGARFKAFGCQREASGAVFQILTEIHATRPAGRNPDAPIDRVIHKARTLMAQRLDRPVSIPMLVRELDVGYSWFRRSFKLHTGCAPGQYHQRLRIDRAAYLLLNTGLSVKEVAAMVGFESPYYFSRAFKKFMERSPAAFRSKELS
jgi:AraC-like DNA-binding protein